MTTDSSTVTLAPAAEPKGGTLSGTVSVKAVNGVAIFANLSLNLSGSYTLSATDGMLTPKVTKPVTISAAQPAALIFVRQPTSTPAGVAFSPTIEVEIVDAFGNVVSSNMSTVSLSIASGPPGGKLAGSVSIAASKGVAAFGKLSLNLVGTYTLLATDGTFSSATSAAITVIGVETAQLVFGPTPTSGSVATDIKPAITVAVENPPGQ